MLSELKTALGGTPLTEEGLKNIFSSLSCDLPQEKAKNVFLVTPWMCKAEWRQVFHLISSLEASKISRAEEIMTAWQSRVDRLPTGVETTLSLLQACLLWCQDPESLSLGLTLSAAIVRFLNLVSHVGLNKFGLKKIHEVAEQFSIPDRLVELRHDVTHGEMKSTASLLEGLAMALKWILESYWQKEALETGENFKSTEQTDNKPELVKHCLECYHYFKTYSMWGHTTMRDFQDDEETFHHLIKLMASIAVRNSEATQAVEKTPKSGKKSKTVNALSVNSSSNDQETFANLRLKELMAIIRNRLHSCLGKQNGRIFGDTLTSVLVEEHLMLPDKDFVETFLEDDEIEIKLLQSLKRLGKLPRKFAESWSEILNMVCKAGLLTNLLSKLFAVTSEDCQQSQFSKDLAAAWIRETLASCGEDFDSGPAKKKSKLSRNEVQVKFEFKSIDTAGNEFQSLLREILLSPNERTVLILPLVLKLLKPRLGVKEENDIKKMVDLFLGKHLESTICQQGQEVDVKCLDSLVRMKEDWRSVDEIDWSQIPLGLCPGQTEVIALEGISKLNDESNYRSNRFTMERLTFMELSNDATFKTKDPNSDEIPAFYRR